MNENLVRMIWNQSSLKVIKSNQRFIASITIIYNFAEKVFT